MARPRKEIDGRKVTQLAKIGCTVEEIASVMDCSKDTLERRFAALIKRGKECFKMSLRRLQFKAAKEGNATMLVWLGKNVLGQKDVQALEHSGPEGKAIQVESIDVRKLSAEQLEQLEAIVAQSSKTSQS